MQFNSVQSGSILNGVADLALGWTETGQKHSVRRKHSLHLGLYKCNTQTTFYMLHSKCAFSSNRIVTC